MDTIFISQIWTILLCVMIIISLLYIFTTYLANKELEKLEPDMWEQLGKYDLIHNNTPTTSKLWMKFVLGKKYIGASPSITKKLDLCRYLFIIACILGPIIFILTIMLIAYS